MTAPKPSHATILCVLVLSVLCIAQTKKPKPEPSFTDTAAITIDVTVKQPSYFVIFNDANCEMVRVTSDDGKVTFGKCYKPDEAAEVFWRYVGGKSPTVLQKRIDELEAEVKKLKAGKP